MSELLSEIFAMVALILFMGLLALMESAVCFAKKTKLQRLAQKGDKRAQKAVEILDSTEELVFATQALISSLALVTGFLGGVTALRSLHAQGHNPLSYHFLDEPEALLLIVPPTILAFIAIGHVLPRVMAKRHPEVILITFSHFIHQIFKITRPLSKRILPTTKEPITKTFTQAKDPLSEKIELLVEKGDKIGATERTILNRILSLEQVKISALMTPTTEISWLDLNESQEEMMRKLTEEGHTRYIVCDGNLDSAIGVVNSRDLFLQWISRSKLDLNECLFKPIVFPENKTAFEVLDRFRKSKLHIGFVMDEYGSLRGLVTMSDLLEAMIGESQEHGDNTKWNAVEREDGSWLFDAITPIHEFKLISQIDSLPGDSDDSYNTLGGFVLYQLEHIPAVAEHFEHDGLRFEVVDMDGHRIDKVRISKEQTPD